MLNRFLSLTIMGKSRNCVLVIKWTDEVKFGPEDKLGHSSLFTCLGRHEAICLSRVRAPTVVTSPLHSF